MMRGSAWKGAEIFCSVGGNRCAQGRPVSMMAWYVRPVRHGTVGRVESHGRGGGGLEGGCKEGGMRVE